MRHSSRLYWSTNRRKYGKIEYPYVHSGQTAQTDSKTLV